MHIIEQLGGVGAVAQALGVRHGAVGNWRRRGWPDAAKYKLLALAHRKGLQLTVEELDRQLSDPGVSGVAAKTDAQ